MFILDVKLNTSKKIMMDSNNIVKGMVRPPREAFPFDESNSNLDYQYVNIDGYSSHKWYTMIFKFDIG